MRDRLHFIVTCQCHDTPEFAHDAYQLLRQSVLVDAPEEIPEINKENEIVELVGQLGELPNKDANKAVQAVVASEKFAIYAHIRDTGEVVEIWNLLTGRRIPWAS